MPLIKRNKAWKRRAYIIAIFVLFFAVAITITLKVFNDNIVFFLNPTELREREAEFRDKEFRVGGLVVAGSIKYLKNKETLQFRITDLNEELTVQYKGIIPNLFTENQGTVALGKLGDKGIFIARELLAKHDENYMPKEIADSLKKSEHWKSKD
ncbi:cytochrome c maturation protein CcmE [Holosporaceae bacterium 'Namur']|nr:cytochrome c maturation protein CcmE [Holosporaceae bacterium 'Namur']